VRFWRVSTLTGVDRERDLPVTPEQVAAWRDGMLIQHAMPHLSIDDREWLITGITPDEWLEEVEE